MRRRPKISLARKTTILKRDRYTCQLCGVTALGNPRVTLEIDHRVPIAQGGSNNDINLWVLCRPCNAAKGARRIEEIFA